jgi:hypothetical protein
MLHIYTRSKYFILICCGVLLWQGCNTINPSEPIPTYIHVDSFHFEENTALHTTLSHQITTVWAFYNNNPIGVFDLPANIPVVTNGTADGKLELDPGVAIDGMNNFLGVYPFYVPDTSHFTPQPGKVINYTPKTKLYTNCKISVLSNFEFGATKFALAGGNIPMTIVSDPAFLFEGGGTGSIFLNAATDSSIDSTITAFTIPSGSAFIEFNYKSDLPFYVGLQAHLSTISSTPYYLAGIKPSDHWQKFYLSVADFAAQYKASTYTFYIKAVNADGQTSGRLLIDNFQLVTF